MSCSKRTCPRCNGSFLPVASELQLCPHCGAEVALAWKHVDAGRAGGSPLDAGELRAVARVDAKQAPTVGQGRPDLVVIEGRRQPHVAHRPPSYDLFLGLTLVCIFTAGYFLLVRRAGPLAPSSALGYALGILGLLLMLATQTLYTLRTRLPGFHFGRTSNWLKAHIVTGLVGPCLVLLHSGGNFRGVAGVLAALTLLIVVSGFVGRYIYTAVPRTIDGAELAVQELELRIADTEREMRAAGIVPTDSRMAGVAWAPRPAWIFLVGRGVRRWLFRRRVRRALRAMHVRGADARRLERMFMRRYDVYAQIARLALARRLLACWYVFHLPLGAVIFTLACVHVAGALYYTAIVR